MIVALHQASTYCCNSALTSSDTLSSSRSILDARDGPISDGRNRSSSSVAGSESMLPPLFPAANPEVRSGPRIRCRLIRPPKPIKLESLLLSNSFSLAFASLSNLPDSLVFRSCRCDCKECCMTQGGSDMRYRRFLARYCHLLTGIAYRQCLPLLVSSQTPSRNAPAASSHLPLAMLKWTSAE